jgi:hypothetical protein
MATTTNYSWNTPDNTAYVKDGASAIRTLGSSVDTTLFTALGGAYPGLRLIKKQTIGSGVTSVSVTSAFSSTYDNYKVLIVGGTSSLATYLNFSLTGGTNAYDYNFIFTTYASAAVSGDVTSNAASFAYGGTGNGANGLDMNVELEAPFLAQQTRFSSTMISDSLAGRAQCRHKAATSYTGFTVASQTGTMTGGTIYVYGYGIS